MTARSDVTVNWDLSPRIITVAAPSTTLTCQDLYDTLRLDEVQPWNMDDLKIVDGEGRGNMGGGLFTEIVVRLRNARVKFADRAGPSTILCTLTGGTLLASDAAGAALYPIEPSAFTSVSIAQNRSGTIVEFGDLVRTTVASGSTASIINTPLTHANDFFAGCSVVVRGSVGAASRLVARYEQASGKITLDRALPFTPALLDEVILRESTFASSDRAKLKATLTAVLS